MSVLTFDFGELTLGPEPCWRAGVSCERAKVHYTGLPLLKLRRGLKGTGEGKTLPLITQLI